MIEIIGNIWNFHDKDSWICITTNGFVKKNGECVMGRGIAKQAKEKFPELARMVGKHIQEKGNTIGFSPLYGIITLPVKHNWWEKADLVLIEEGIKQLANNLPVDMFKKILLVRPGCGNGQLDWKDVKPILEKYLKEDRFIVVNPS